MVAVAIARLGLQAAGKSRIRLAASIGTAFGRAAATGVTAL
jgi:hypothetical protein